MGTMRERSPGTWELTVSTGWDPTKGRYGRVIRTVRTSSRREVKAALARLEVEAAGGHVGTADPTVAQLLDRWMERLARLGRSDSTLYNSASTSIASCSPPSATSGCRSSPPATSTGCTPR